jgi:hypothetical protein
MSLFHHDQPIHPDSMRDRYARFTEVSRETLPRWRHVSPRRQFLYRMRPMLRLARPMILAAMLVWFVVVVADRPSWTGFGAYVERTSSFTAANQLLSTRKVARGLDAIHSGQDQQAQIVVVGESENRQQILLDDATIQTLEGDVDRSTLKTTENENDDTALHHKEAAHKEQAGQAVADVQQPKMPSSDRKTVEAALNPEEAKVKVISAPGAPAPERPFEQESPHHLSLEDIAESLPDLVHVPFEDAVTNEKLMGWEDEWVSEATFREKRWGSLNESKIDFVYLCEFYFGTGAPAYANLR